MRSRVVRGAGESYAGCGSGGVRGAVPDVRAAQRASRAAGSAAATPRSAGSGARGAVAAALGGIVDSPVGSTQVRSELRAAGYRAAGGAPEVYAAGLRGPTRVVLERRQAGRD